MDNAKTIVLIKMDANGRITIPEEIRSKVGAKDGTRFELYYDEQKAEISLCKYNPYRDILVYLKKALCDMGLLYGDTDVVNEGEREEISDAIKVLTGIRNRMDAIILK